jgi:hypothetical protein
VPDDSQETVLEQGEESDQAETTAEPSEPAKPSDPSEPSEPSEPSDSVMRNFGIVVQVLIGVGIVYLLWALWGLVFGRIAYIIGFVGKASGGLLAKMLIFHLLPYILITLGAAVQILLLALFIKKFREKKPQSIDALFGLAIVGAISSVISSILRVFYTNGSLVTELKSIAFALLIFAIQICVVIILCIKVPYVSKWFKLEHPQSIWTTSRCLPLVFLLPNSFWEIEGDEQEVAENNKDGAQNESS